MVPVAVDTTETGVVAKAQEPLEAAASQFDGNVVVAITVPASAVASKAGIVPSNHVIVGLVPTCDSKSSAAAFR